MAGARDGKKGSEDSGSKKKVGKPSPLGTPAHAEPLSQAPEEAPVAFSENASARPAGDAPIEAAPLDLADEAPIGGADEAPADEAPADKAIYALIDADDPVNEAEDDPAEPTDGTLDLHGVEERLPWLESDDDFDQDGGDRGDGRIAGFMLGGLLALAAIVGGIWWVAHRDGAEEIADGGVIEAPAVAYKEAPKNPGGKTFDGTGDSSFAMSEGKNPAARLGEDKLAPRPVESAAPKPAASASSGLHPDASTAPTATGVGVQVAAFSSKSTAEAGWTRLVGQHEALKGVPHRIVEGRADIGTVYRLQAVPGDLAAANALCARLKAAGAACQVKR